MPRPQHLTAANELIMNFLRTLPMPQFLSSRFSTQAPLLPTHESPVSGLASMPTHNAAPRPIQRTDNKMSSIVGTTIGYAAKPWMLGLRLAGAGVWKSLELSMYMFLIFMSLSIFLGSHIFDTASRLKAGLSDLVAQVPMPHISGAFPVDDKEALASPHESVEAEVHNEEEEWHNQQLTGVPMNSCMYVDKTSYFEEVLVIRVLESALVDETTGQHEEMSEQREQSENEVEDLGLDSEDGNLNHVFLFARDDGALVEEDAVPIASPSENGDNAINNLLSHQVGLSELLALASEKTEVGEPDDYYYDSDGSELPWITDPSSIKYKPESLHDSNDAAASSPASPTTPALKKNISTKSVDNHLQHVFLWTRSNSDAVTFPAALQEDVDQTMTADLRHVFLFDRANEDLVHKNGSPDLDGSINQIKGHDETIKTPINDLAIDNHTAHLPVMDYSARRKHGLLTPPESPETRADEIFTNSEGELCGGGDPTQTQLTSSENAVPSPVGNDVEDTVAKTLDDPEPASSVHKQELETDRSPLVPTQANFDFSFGKTDVPQWPVTYSFDPARTANSSLGSFGAFAARFRSQSGSVGSDRGSMSVETGSHTLSEPSLVSVDASTSKRELTPEERREKNRLRKQQRKAAKLRKKQGEVAGARSLEGAESVKEEGVKGPASPSRDKKLAEMWPMGIIERNETC